MSNQSSVEPSKSLKGRDKYITYYTKPKRRVCCSEKRERVENKTNCEARVGSKEALWGRTGETPTTNACVVTNSVLKFQPTHRHFCLQNPCNETKHTHPSTHGIERRNKKQKHLLTSNWGQYTLKAPNDKKKKQDIKERKDVEDDDEKKEKDKERE